MGNDYSCKLESIVWAGSMFQDVFRPRVTDYDAKAQCQR